MDNDVGTPSGPGTQNPVPDGNDALTHEPELYTDEQRSAGSDEVVIPCNIEDFDDALTDYSTIIITVIVIKDQMMNLQTTKRDKQVDIPVLNDDDHEAGSISVNE